MKEMVILVNEKDEQVGFMEKIEAHKKGLLHRAVSVFIFNSKDEMLLQKRADGKYHSPGLWTNTACSHPMPHELTDKAAARRLKQEMGIQNQLHPAFTFMYHVRFKNGLIEHEFDHVYIGYSDSEPDPDWTEVSDWKFISREKLTNTIRFSPADFTEWFKLCYEKAFDEAQQLKTIFIH